jgi:4-diphosphocytidyl-2-C-methyl-D-erythritol kinase
MKEIKVKAYAKINLSLDVLNRRDDGYHDIKTIMQQVDLFDTIIIRDSEKDIIIECDNLDVPLDSSNLAYKAWQVLKEKYDINRGTHIKIEKRIPVAAGLAGGSSDAAAVLKGLNQLWNLKLSDKELMDMGYKIGADVPFCIMGGTALAEGIGEKLTKLEGFSDKLVLLAKPDISVSTAYVYKNLNLKEITTHPDTDAIIKYIKDNKLELVAENMVNVLESVTIKEYPIIKRIKEEMLKFGAVGSLMSGSGPTVFGLFKNVEDIENCRRELNKWLNTVYIVKTL